MCTKDEVYMYNLQGLFCLKVSSKHNKIKMESYTHVMSHQYASIKTFYEDDAHRMYIIHYQVAISTLTLAGQCCIYEDVL